MRNGCPYTSACPGPIDAHPGGADAPELNPVEIFWAYLKINPLANFAVSLGGTSERSLCPFL